jgi:hypothetical protein
MRVKQDLKKAYIHAKELAPHVSLLSGTFHVHRHLALPDTALLPELEAAHPHSTHPSKAQTLLVVGKFSHLI